MAIALDTIRSLDASKTYYIANSTGEIKEAGAWQKFKCFFGIGAVRRPAAPVPEPEDGGSSGATSFPLKV